MGRGDMAGTQDDRFVPRTIDDGRFDADLARAAIQDQLQNALKDPKAFMNGLSPEQQARIRSLASEIEKKNPPPAK